MAISDALHTAHANLLRVIPKPLTAEEEAERVRTGKGHPDIDPAALHDGARRFVDALSADSAAAAELTRRGTLCATLTGNGSAYSLAAKKAQKALAGWNPAGQFAEHTVYLDFVQKTVHNLLNGAGEELVAGVREKYEGIKWLLGEDGVPGTLRSPLEAWRDAAWSIISKGENDSLDGCYWLLHAENLKHALFVPAAAPEVRQAAEALVRWLEEQSKPGGGTTDQGGAGDPNFCHSEDFRSVVWSGTSYTFTRTQAACVKVLWAAWKAGTPELDGLTVVTRADVAQTRLIDVFRSKGKAHAAWGTMIAQGQSKGAYRLSDRATVTSAKPRRKQSRKTTRKTHR